MKIIFLSLLSLSIVSCSHTETARERAKFDLDCKNVVTQDLPGGSIGATGCGKRAAYKCWGPWMGLGSQCLKESETTK